MNHTAIWRRLRIWRLQPPAGPDKPASDAPEHDLRRRCLERMARDGMPLWREGPENCDGCGRELLLGERARLMHHGDELLLACPLCAERLSDEGFRAVASEAEAGPLEEHAIPLRR